MNPKSKPVICKHKTEPGVPLTFGKWMKMHMESGEYVFDIQLYREFFEEIKTDQYLIDNFLSLDPELQHHAQQAILSEISLYTISTYLRLRQKTDAECPGYVDKCRNQTDSSARLEIPHRIGLVALEFSKCQIERDQELKSYVSHNALEQHFYMSDLVIYCLWGLHGQSRLEEILKFWKANYSKANLADFINVVDRWEEIKDYPLDWALQTIERS